MINDMHNEMLTSPKFKKLKERFFLYDKVDEQIYLDLHSLPITPLGIFIDLDLYNYEIEQVKDHFQPWGINKNKTNRYGLALTKPEFETTDYPDPGNWPLDIWTYNHPDQPLLDPDLIIPTKWWDHFTSLAPMYEKFNKHICRTNVTLWNEGGQFYPHIDVLASNAINYRLWMSNKTGEDHILKIGSRDDEENLINYSNQLIPGQVYLLDTSRTHHGIANVDNVSSMLMSILPSGTDIIKSLI